MTKRHFQAVADIICKYPPFIRNQLFEDFCKLFSAENPRFDADRFRAACALIFEAPKEVS